MSSLHVMAICLPVIEHYKDAGIGYGYACVANPFTRNFGQWSDLRPLHGWSVYSYSFLRCQETSSVWLSLGC